jgi:hypothetical protein
MNNFSGLMGFGGLFKYIWNILCSMNIYYSYYIYFSYINYLCKTIS